MLSCKQALTWAAYIHVAFQPLVVNFYFLWGQVSNSSGTRCCAA